MLEGCPHHLHELLAQLGQAAERVARAVQVREVHRPGGILGQERVHVAAGMFAHALHGLRAMAQHPPQREAVAEHVEVMPHHARRRTRAQQLRQEGQPAHALALAGILERHPDRREFHGLARQIQRQNLLGNDLVLEVVERGKRMVAQLLAHQRHHLARPAQAAAQHHRLRLRRMRRQRVERGRSSGLGHATPPTTLRFRGQSNAMKPPHSSTRWPTLSPSTSRPASLSFCASSGVCGSTFRISTVLRFSL